MRLEVLNGTQGGAVLSHDMLLERRRFSMNAAPAHKKASSVPRSVLSMLMRFRLRGWPMGEQRAACDRTAEAGAPHIKLMGTLCACYGYIPGPASKKRSFVYSCHSSVLTTPQKLYPKMTKSATSLSSPHPRAPCSGRRRKTTTKPLARRRRASWRACSPPRRRRGRRRRTRAGTSRRAGCRRGCRP